MKKLYEALNINEEGVPKGDYGIEIEIEGRNLSTVNNRWWKTERDGSLRGESGEYILKSPIPLKEVNPVLKNLAIALKDAQFDFSFRTSVHVHMNILQLTYPQLLNLLYTYLILEEPLMNFCGRERKGNRFCLRIQDAEGVLDTYAFLFKEGERGLRYIEEERIRYSALNLAALTRYGSLEFRGMKGTMDIVKLTQWVHILNTLRDYAITKESPIDVHEELAELGAQGFAKKVFGEFYDVLYYARLSSDIQRSFSLTIDLPYMYKEVVEAKPAEKKEKYKFDEFDPGRVAYHLGRARRLHIPVELVDGWLLETLRTEQQNRPAARFVIPNPLDPEPPRRNRVINQDMQPVQIFEEEL